MEIIDSLKRLDSIQSKLADERLNSGLSFHALFRGQSKFSYKLLPNISRNQNDVEAILSIEKKEYKNIITHLSSAEASLKFQLPENLSPNLKEWFLFSQARHYGMQTRLLDWSISPQIALLFAIENEKHYKEDGSFFIMKCPLANHVNYTNWKTELQKSIVDNDKFMILNIPFFQDSENDKKNIAERKRFRQSGRFSVSPNKMLLSDLSESIPFIEKFLIPAAYKKSIKNELEAINLTSDWINYNKNS